MLEDSRSRADSLTYQYFRRLKVALHTSHKKRDELEAKLAALGDMQAGLEAAREAEQAEITRLTEKNMAGANRARDLAVQNEVHPALAVGLLAETHHGAFGLRWRVEREKFSELWANPVQVNP